MNLADAVRVLLAASAVLAAMLAVRRNDHRPVAWWLGSAAVAAGLRAAVREAGLLQAVADADGAALVGVSRVMGHVNQALFLVWPAALAAGSIVVFTGRSRAAWGAFGAWALTVGAFAAAYTHGLRGPVLSRAYLAVELVALCVAACALVVSLTRRRAFGLPQTVALLIGTIDALATVAVHRGLVFERWPLAQVSFLALYVALVVLHGGALWISPRSSPSASA